MVGNGEKGDNIMDQEKAPSATRPMEPERKKSWKQDAFKWLMFLLVILYVLLTYYHAPILTRVGRFLIVTHPPQKSDLIVCLAGANIERGLAAADAYQKDLAPRIFTAMEEPPDSFELLKEKGIEYPRSVDLQVRLLTELGVPQSAILISDRPAKSTIEEAEMLKEVAVEKGYTSILVITSPTHTRRALLTYKKVFEKIDVRILMYASSYSKFNPEDWWKQRRYVRAVIIEYQKLLFYFLRYYL